MRDPLVNNQTGFRPPTAPNLRLRSPFPTFPGIPVYEPAPDVVLKSADPAAPIVGIWRYSVPPGYEALLNWSAWMSAVVILTPANVGPVPDASVTAYTLPWNVPKGSFLALSDDEKAALSQPAPVSQSQGASWPLLYAGTPMAMAKNMAIPEATTLVVILEWDNASSETRPAWGQLQGWRWIKGSLNAGEKLLLALNPAVT